MSDVPSSLPPSSPAAPPAMGATSSRAAGTLKSGHLGLWHAIVISVAVMSPASSIFFNTIPQAQQAGAAIPLCYVIGFVVALLVANQYSELSRELPSAGSAFTYVIEGLGPRWGFLTGWIGLIAVALGAPFTFVIMSANLQAIVARWTGINLHWTFYFVAATGIVFALCYIGVRESLRVDLAFLAFEIFICLLLAAIVLLRVGQQGGLAVAPFTTSPVPANGSLAIGVIFAVLSFIGFEMAATLAEETANPRRNIPRAVFGAMIVVGIFYIIMAYAATIGYGPDKMATGYGNDPAPFDTIARHFGGPVFAAIIDLVGVFSFFSAALAIVNGGSRILFAIGRDGMLPRWLGWTHPTRQTPGAAITLLCGIGLVVGIGMGLLLAPLNAFEFMGTLDALFILLIYVLVNATCMRFFWRKRRAQFSFWRHGLLPALGLLFSGLIFIAAIASPGSGALAYAPVVVGVWLVIGVVVLLVLGRRLVAAVLEQG